MGPATIGSTTRVPATRGPQRRPASAEATTSSGASSSFSAKRVIAAEYRRKPALGEGLQRLRELDHVGAIKELSGGVAFGPGEVDLRSWVRRVDLPPPSGSQDAGRHDSDRTTLTQSSCFCLNTSYASGACSNGTRCVMTKLGSISPRSIRLSNGLVYRWT
jgi:hypothetical protein